MYRKIKNHANVSSLNIKTPLSPNASIQLDFLVSEFFLRLKSFFQLLFSMRSETEPTAWQYSRENASESHQTEPLSDCIYHLPTDKSIRKW